MTSETIVQEGITAFKAGEKQKARELLQQAVRRNPRDQAAWLWLSAVVPDVDKQRSCLERVRHIDPDNEYGMRALKGLASLPPVLEQSSNGTPAASYAAPTMTAAPARDVPSEAPSSVTTVTDEPAHDEAPEAAHTAPTMADERANGSSFAMPASPAHDVPAPTPITIPTLPDAPPVPADRRRAARSEKRVMSLRDMMYLIGLSLLFGAIGIGMIILSGAASQGADAAAAAPVVSGASLERMESGQQVIIEGHISRNNPQREEDFVAYIYQVEERRRVRDSDGDYRWKTSWETRSTFRQPLNIDTSEGTARISSSSYRLSSPRHTVTRGDRRWRGFKAGDPVMALGIIRSAGLNASVLHGGNKESYVSGQRLQATMLFWVGIMLVIGTVISAGVYAWRHG